MIRVRDNPGAWWLLALLFIVPGLWFVYLGISRASDFSWWQGPLAILMGAIAVAVGIWRAGRAPLSTVFISPSERQLRLVQIGIYGKRVQAIPFGRIKDVVVERQSDDEGGVIARPALLLRDGRRVPLSALWQRDLKRITTAVAKLRSGIRSSPFAGIDLDAEGSEDAEVTEGAEGTEIKAEDPPS